MTSKRYFVATDGPVYSGRQEARLYKTTGYRSQIILSARGTFDQMQDLADELNGTEQVKDPKENS